MSRTKQDTTPKPRKRRDPDGGNPKAGELPQNDAHPGCASPEAEALIARLADLHAECEARTLAVEQTAWVEGEIAFQLHTDHKFAAKTIASALNTRTTAGVGIRRKVRSRWIQRLIEVHLVFRDPATRVAEATWKMHSTALDIARIELDLSGKKAEKMTSGSCKKLAATAGNLLSKAVKEAGPTADPEVWLEEKCFRARQEARWAREADIPPPSSATTVVPPGETPTSDALPDGGTRQVFDEAMTAVQALLDAQPSLHEVAALEALISRLWDAAA